MTTTFSQIYRDLLKKGAVSSPRGQRTLEILNYQYTLAPFDRFAAFPSRKLSMQYIKQELKWYLRGDPHDLSICQHAKIWEQCVTDGVLHSNYGYYLFRQKGLEYVIDLLRKDPESRRAVVPILGHQHLFIANKDVPCTVSLGFRIREDRLCCTVHMRSQDAVYGMGNDVPFFSVVQEMVAVRLGLELGTLTVFVESFHAYERHWALLRDLTVEEQEHWEIPKISDSLEVEMLLEGDDSDYALSRPFTRWLYVQA